MALTGNLFTSYLKTAYLPQSVSTIFLNDIWFRQPLIEVVPPAGCLPGPSININLNTAVSSSAGVYVQGSPQPSAHTLTDVRAYFTKDFYQETAKIYGDTIAMLANGGSTTGEDAVKKSIDLGVMNLKAAMTARFLTDLAAQVDASTAYSDASLTRATYSIQSYEANSVSALARADLIDAVEALQSGSYGPAADISDLVWLMPPNQHTNVAQLTSGAEYLEFSTDAQNFGPADAGVKFRCHSFEGIPILQIPGMTTTEIYLLKRSATKIYMHKDIEIEPSPTNEWAQTYLLTAGANLVVSDPRCCAKLDGITA